MKTYVYAEHCVRAGDVVLPQPEGRDRQSNDYISLTLGQAREILAARTQPNPGASGLFRRQAAQNVLSFRG